MMIDLKLQDMTHDQVADLLGISGRTVRRLFMKLQRKLARSLGVTDAGAAG
jgi:DNA-binding CsgD family transcriptional regulator